MRALVTWLLLLASLVGAQAAVRIKDVTSLRGARDAQLIGYGLVVGLQGTGDSMRNAPFTDHALQSMLEQMGLAMRGNSMRNKNVAAVIVTADMPFGTDGGQRLDVTVSSLGDATSLMGGTLLLTQLASADGQPHASAQGAVTVTGFDAAGQAENVSQGVPTAGRIPNGAIIERPIDGPIDQLRMFLELRNPDYATAMRIIDAINAFSHRAFRRTIAFERDARSVELLRPASVSTPRLMAEIGDLLVDPDTAARVVVDSRTGTVVIGQDVQISTVAVTHGTLNVRITETPKVSQPAPLSNGKTVVTPKTQINVNESGGQVAVVSGASLRALVSGLNRLGVKPSGVIAILQAIKSAGALQADLIVQ
ncbi:MAG TPA: flagellar basal body P-ring protein FlgI [Roseiarcus sp.]|nr:flagellar basal body P-ring protein FlgI [Roseiarcus sp.]